MRFIGSKEDPDLYENLIKQHLPEDLSEMTYVEPFGGSFGLAKIIENSPKTLIYNDLHIHDVDIDFADEIYHIDYKEIIDKYDSEDTVFYLGDFRVTT